MTLQTCLTVLILVFCINNSLGTLECRRINTSCKEIYTAERFKFFHGCPKGSEIYVSANGTAVAYAVLGNSMPKNLNDVIANDSVITRHCRDLKVKCVVHIGETDVDEICRDYKVTVMPNPDSFQPPTPRNLIVMPNPDSFQPPTPWNLIIGGALGGALGGAGLILLIGGLYMWKRKEIVADDVDTTQPNDVIRLNDIPATDSCGSGESAIEQDNTLESVHVHSIDPTADGQPPQSVSLDRNSSKPGIQPTASGDVVVSDGNWASNHRAMNRGLRDDPGGENDNNGKAIIGIAEMHSGWTAGDRGPEDHENEEQPLLSKQRAADQGFDMTGKAEALVYKHGFDPDQVSRCSTVPDTDVESTPNMNNCSIHEY